MSQGQLPLLRRHIEQGLNLGLAPDQVVEVFIQLTFYVGVPSVESALRITKEVFKERAFNLRPQTTTTSTRLRKSFTTRAQRPTESISEIYSLTTRPPYGCGDAAFGL